MEVFHEPPNPDSFVPLAEHQSRTPESFYSGPPILHHLSERCKVVILEKELSSTPALSGLRPSSNGQGASNGPSGFQVSEDGMFVIDDVNVWVTSEYGQHLDTCKLRSYG